MQAKKLILTVVAAAGLSAVASAGTFDLLFIHHSVGRGWLNAGLRADLENTALNSHVFRVHDSYYGDTIGDYTDFYHWFPKFRDQMALVRTFDKSTDVYYTTPGRFNQIVMFKSCYPNSAIKSVGTPPGDPVSPVPALVNFQAAYNACADIFKNYPGMLFVAVTAPPLNPAGTNAADAARARQFNNWLKTTWVQNYQATTGLKNVMVFDYFDVLANDPNHATEPNMLKAAYRTGNDSHPTAVGHQAATPVFLPLLDAAVNAWLASTGNGGCPGYNQLVPQLAGVGTPRLGNSTFAMTLGQARPMASSVLLISGVSTNIPLGGGCSLLVGQPTVVFPFLTDTAGAASIPMPIPNNTVLLGGHFYFQSFIFDSAGPIGPGVLTGSNGLDITVVP